MQVDNLCRWYNPFGLTGLVPTFAARRGTAPAVAFL